MTDSSSNPPSPFTIFDLEQDTDAWRQWRTGGIGGSDAPVIMGENPWKSAKQLLREKRNPEGASPRVMTPAMVRGLVLEPKARAAYCRIKGISVEPLCAENRDQSWLRCSMDGICLKTMQAVEIKCGRSAYRHTARYQTVPAMYYGQLQHTMAVTGLDRMDYFCFLPDRRPLMVNVERDTAYIDRLIQKEAEFWAAINQ